MLPRGLPSSAQTIRVAPAQSAVSTSGGIPVAVLPPSGVRPQLMQQPQQVIRLGSNPQQQQQTQFYQLQRSTVVAASQQPPASSTASSSSAAQPPQYQYRIIVPSNTSLRRLSVLNFNSSQVPDLSISCEASLQRLGRFGRTPTAVAAAIAAAAEAELPSQQQQKPQFGEGSAYRQAERDEAKKRRLAGAYRRFNPFNQPMQLSISGSGREGARKFKGSREGGITANAAYWVFMKSDANTFEALPADDFYKFVPDVAYRHFNSEEAEEQFSRRDKTLNKYNLMLQHRLNVKEEDGGGGGGGGGGDKKAAGGSGSGGGADRDDNDGEEFDRVGARSSRRSRLQLTDMDEFGDGGGDSDEGDDADDRGDASTSKAGAKSAGSGSKKGGGAVGGKNKRRAPRFKRKRKEGQPASDEEGGAGADPDGEVEDESELDDHEGDELDYLTNSSSGSVSESEKVEIYEEKGLDQEDAIKVLLVSEDEEESDAEKANADGEKNGNTENGKKSGASAAAGSSSGSRAAVGGKGGGEADDDDDEDDDESRDESKSSSNGADSDSDGGNRDSSKKEKQSTKDKEAKKAKKKKHKKSSKHQSVKEAEKREALVKRIKEKAQYGGGAASSAGSSVADSDGPPTKRQKTGASAPTVGSADLIEEAEIRRYLGRRPMTLAELSKKLRGKFKKYKEMNKSVLFQALAAALAGLFERQEIKKTTVNAVCTYSLSTSGGR